MINAKIEIMMITAVILLNACATTSTYQGVFVPKEYVDKFEPGPEGGVKLRWIKEGVDFAKYKKVMVDYVVFALAPDSDYKAINGDEMKKLADAASLSLVRAFQEKKVTVASEPGPDVSRVRLAIVDLEQSRPVFSAVTTVVPVGIGISLVQRGVTGEWSGSGLTKAEMMVLDSMTNEVLAAGYDEYSAKFTERYTKWGSVEDAFHHWGEVILKAYANLTGVKE